MIGSSLLKKLVQYLMVIVNSTHLPSPIKLDVRKSSLTPSYLLIVTRIVIVIDFRRDSKKTRVTEAVNNFGSILHTSEEPHNTTKEEP
jgi:hypothetical protein